MFFFQRSCCRSVFRPSSVIDFSDLNLLRSKGAPPANTTVLLGRTATVALNYATNSPYFSDSTGYGMIRSCSKHSFRPTLAASLSWHWAIENGRVGKRLLTSTKKARALFDFRL